MANGLVCMIDYYFNQPPPSLKCVPWNADHMTFELIFCPNQPFPDAKPVGAHMLIRIYAQSQSKYISVFSLILFLYHFHFTVHTPFQFFPNFSLFFLAILFTSKACHFDMALLILLPCKRPHSHAPCRIKSAMRALT